MARVLVAYDSYGLDDVDEEFIHFIFDMTLSHAAGPAESEVGLVVTSDDHIRALNKRYRGVDRPTNVLSFSNDELKGFVKPPVEKDDNYLGDIYIAYPTLMREAHDLKETSRERFVTLFVHGVLHLLGFDHEDSQDASVMEQLEDKIVNSIL